jgi:hypothetical protein
MGKLQQQQQEVEEFAQLKSTPTSYPTNPKASKRFNRVCVFCGSSSGNGTVYSNVALNLGRELVRTILHDFFKLSLLHLFSQLTVADVTMAVSICVTKHSVEPEPQIVRHNLLCSHK